MGRTPISGIIVITLAFGAGACDLLTGPDEVRFESLVAGGAHTCARATEGGWYCWGHAEAYRAGESGADVVRDWTRPAVLDGDPGLVMLSAISASTCGLTSSGAAYCWGSNGSGELGIGERSSDEILTPVAVETEIRFSSLATISTATYMCGLSDGKAYCWGNNFRRQLGAGLDDFSSPSVVPVLGEERFTLIAGGGAANCALTEATDVYCWGALVPGLENDLHQPTLIAAATGFDTLVARAGARCGLRSGRAYCHGINSYGSLGTGDTLAHEGFVEVAGGLEFDQLSAGRVHVCGITLDDHAYCWGAGQFGRLGRGSEEDALAPVRVGGGHRWHMLAPGGEHTCGLTTAGRVYCWGRGLWGQIGNGRTDDQHLPVRIAAPID